MTIKRLSEKEDSYKNFRRNMLAYSIDSKFYLRIDEIDNENDIHNAFDFGFLTAVAKIKNDIGILENQYISGELEIEKFFLIINQLLHERLEITYGKNQDARRGFNMEKIINQNIIRISDDF